MREHILSEIRRLAATNGQAPGSSLFATETGIGEHHWRGKFWARWGDALTEAGFQPNQWTARTDAEAVLHAMAQACRQFGHIPTWDEYRMYRWTNASAPSDRAARDLFNGREGLFAALLERARTDNAFADILPMLPTHVTGPREREPSQPANSTPKDGFVYLIQSGEFYKIGRSDDLERRVKQITVSLPDKASLLHSIRTDDPPGIEAYWHRRFAEKRANGEWFKLTSRDVAAFKKRKFQ